MPIDGTKESTARYLAKLPDRELRARLVCMERMLDDLVDHWRGDVGFYLARAARACRVELKSRESIR